MVQPVNALGADVALSDLPVLLVLAISVLVVTIASMTKTWNATGHLVTLVHESGHALAGLVVGRRPRSIVVRSDMSGATLTAAPLLAHRHDHRSHTHRSLGALTPRMPVGPQAVAPLASGARALLGSRASVRTGEIWTAWWGYPFPAVVGMGLVLAAVHGWTPAALVALLFAALGALALSRSILTLGLSVLSVVALAALWMLAPSGFQVTATYSLGLFLLAGAVRLLLILVRTHLRGEREERLASDAGALAAMTKVPAMMWLFSFTACIVTAGLIGTAAALGALFS